MIKKIYICTDDENQLKLLTSEFNDVEIIKIINLSYENYLKSTIFNIINTETLMMVDLFQVPIRNLFSQIVATNGKYNFPEYIVTTPVFLNESLKLSDKDKFKYIAEVPIAKVLEFSKENEKGLIYGVHVKLLFTYLEFNKNSCQILKEIFVYNLIKNKII